MAGTSPSKFVLTSSHKALRSSFRRPDGEPANLTVGHLLQINTIDQFSDWSRASVQEFKAPNAVCGFCTIGNAMMLSRLLRMDRRQVVSVARFAEIVAELRDETKALNEMRVAMRFVHDERVKWINKQPDSYWEKRSKVDCLRVWAANHELSDFMRARVAAGDTSLDYVNFLRYNQWPERDGGQWEEAERLVEEEPFGGINEGCKATVDLEPGASRFIVERFGPSRALQRPEEWLKEEHKREQQAAGKPLPPNIFMLDLNGHYAVGVGLLLEASNGPTPTFVVFNTTENSFLSNGTPTVAFDLSFPLATTSPTHSDGKPFDKDKKNEIG